MTTSLLACGHGPVAAFPGPRLGLGSPWPIRHVTALVQQSGCIGVRWYGCRDAPDPSRRSRVGPHGEIPEEAVRHLVKAVSAAEETARHWHAAGPLAFATAVVRGAPDRLDALRSVHAETGIRLSTLPGELEGELTFLGARLCGERRLVRSELRVGLDRLAALAASERALLPGVSGPPQRRRGTGGTGRPAHRTGSGTDDRRRLTAYGPNSVRPTATWCRSAYGTSGRTGMLSTVV